MLLKAVVKSKERLDAALDKKKIILAKLKESLLL